MGWQYSVSEGFLNTQGAGPAGCCGRMSEVRTGKLIQLEVIQGDLGRSWVVGFCLHEGVALGRG